ncbi:MAG: sensor histidine kinase [Deltaproteobacteria bacterium]|nr:sensor histidine kinase [Deltaproteobacteria bacterium]
MIKIQRVFLRPWAVAAVMLVCFTGIITLFQYYDYSTTNLVHQNNQAHQLADSWDGLVSCTKDLLISNDLTSAIAHWKQSILAFDQNLQKFKRSDLTVELMRNDTEFKRMVDDTENLWQVIKPRIEYIQLRFEEYAPGNSDNESAAKRSLLHELLFQMEQNVRSTEYVMLFDLTYDIEYMISSLDYYFHGTLINTVEIIFKTIERRSLQLRLTAWFATILICIFTMLFIFLSQRALNTTASQLKFLTNRLMDAEDTERRRLAQELHDEIGQSLTGIKYGVDNAIGLFELEKSKEGIAALNSLVTVIQNAISEARRISVSLWPAVLDQLGIIATISWYCRVYQKRYPDIILKQSVTVHEDEVSKDLKIVLYRVLQEALTNIAKHSSAENVTVRLNRVKELLRFSITDDGPGFNLHAVEGTPTGPDHGFGLISMRERVELSGGELDIDSSQGRGTRITASWVI